MKQKKYLLLTILLIASLWLAACGSGGTETAGGSDGSPTVDGFYLDPANTSSDNSNTAAAYLYESLVGLQDGEVVGLLAESYTVSDDGLDYIFNLRAGVAFHDGTTLDADAVIANFTRWFDPSSPLRGSGDFAAWAEAFHGFKGEIDADGKAKSQVDGIEKVNGLTVLVHLNTPDPKFLEKLADPAFSIVSPAVLASGGDGGTNKYKMATVKGSTLTLEPFAGYWDPAAIPSEGMDIAVE